MRPIYHIMKPLMHKESNNNNGQMTIISVISLCLILLTVTLSQLFLGYSEYSQGIYDNYSAEALEVAESAVENAIYEYGLNKLTYTNQTFSTPIGNAVVSLSANTSVSPNTVSITSRGTYKNISRTENVTFTISPPPQLTQEAAFSQNNMFTNGATLNGEIFTNNDFTFENTTLNGDLYGAGKGNGQKGCLDNTTVNQYNGSGGNVYVWDPTYFMSNTLIKGNVYYHTSVDNKNCFGGGGTDNSVTIQGTETKQSNSFLPPIANPTFSFPAAKSLATQNGTYFSDYNTFFNSYLPSLCSTSGGCTTTPSTVQYNLQPGIYFVDCTAQFGLECTIPSIFGWKDSQGRYQAISGSGISLIFNNSFIDFGGINISSPYQSGASYYPSLVSNGDMTLLSGSTSNISVNITGLVYSFGTINAWGVSSSTQTIINGGIWASNQINLWQNTNITYNQAYVQNVTGFNLSQSITHVTSWYEN